MPNTTDDLDDAILDAAVEGIDSVTADGASVKQIPLKDRIEAARHLKAQTAAERNHFGLRIVKLKPPGGGV